MRKTIYYPLVFHSRLDVYRGGNDKEKAFLKSQFCILRLEKNISLVISDGSAGRRSNEKSLMLALILVQRIPACLKRRQQDGGQVLLRPS